MREHDTIDNFKSVALFGHAIKQSSYGAFHVSIVELKT